MKQGYPQLFSLFRKGIIKIIWNNEQFLSLPINAFCVVVQNDEIAVDLRLTPRIRTRTASGDPVWSDYAMSCQRSPASFLLPPPKVPQARSLVRVPIRVHGNFLAI